MLNRLKAYRRSLQTLGVQGFFTSRLSEDNYSVRPFGTDLYLRPGTDDAFLLEEIYWNKRYELPIELVEEVHKKKKINALEIGAHTGISTQRWLSQIPQDIELNAFLVEPNPNNYQLLKQNISNRTGFHFLNFAISDTQQEILLSTPQDEKGTLMFAWTNQSFTNNQPRIERVLAKPLASVISNFHSEPIDLLIFDAEGAEADIDWMNNITHFSYIFMETHEHLLTNSSVKFNQAVHQHNYKLLHRYDDNNFLYSR